MKKAKRIAGWGIMSIIAVGILVPLPIATLHGKYLFMFYGVLLGVTILIIAILHAIKWITDE